MIKRILPFLASTFFCCTSWGHLTSDFDVSWGFSSIDVLIDGVSSRNLESYSTIEVGYNLLFNAADTAINISFQEIVGSNFGESIPYTRLAIGPKWFPRGLNGKRALLDNQVQGRVWRPSPFMGIQVGISNLSLQDQEDGFQQSDFNAAIIDANVEIGVETPITSDWLLVGQFSYVTSFLSGGDSDGSDERPEITYSGIQILIGLKITKF